MLSQKELTEGGNTEQLGAADWIAAGLRVEDMKHVSLTCPLHCIRFSNTLYTRLSIAHMARRIKATSGTD